MNQYDYSMTCKSCGVQYKKLTMNCFKCNKSNALNQCNAQTKAGAQCKVKTINTKCLYHNMPLACQQIDYDFIDP